MPDDLLARLRKRLSYYEHEMAPGRSVMLLREAAAEIERLRGLLAGGGTTVASAGSKGGKARAANLTAGERSRAARAAVNARWAKRRAAEGEGG